MGGIWYRNLDSFILLGGIQYKKFRIGYSYDFTISKLTNATGGAHEVSLGFTIPCRPPLKEVQNGKMSFLLKNLKSVSPIRNTRINELTLLFN